MAGVIILGIIGFMIISAGFRHAVIAVVLVALAIFAALITQGIWDPQPGYCDDPNSAECTLAKSARPDPNPYRRYAKPAAD